jgi:1-acyl-sn-glycerol-3-phosphate acyltransferase
VVGAELFPREVGVLVVLNHLHDIDPPFVSVGIGDCGRIPQFLTKSEHFQARWLSWLLTALGCFPVRQGRPDLATLRYARERLRAGCVVGIFPEGRPSGSDRMGPFLDGAGFLAITEGIAVVPAAIWGTHRVMLGRWLPLRRGPVTLAFGPPVAIPVDGARRERVTAATRACEAAVGELLGGLVRAERTA